MREGWLAYSFHRIILSKALAVMLEDSKEPEGHPVDRDSQEETGARLEHCVRANLPARPAEKKDERSKEQKPRTEKQTA